MKKRFRLSRNIKTELAFQFMLVVAGILIFFAILVYIFTYTTHREKFRTNLFNRATNTAIIYSSSRSGDTALLRKIHQSTFSGQNQEIVISDSNLKIHYRFNVSSLTRDEMHDKLKDGTYGYYTIGQKDGIYFRFESKRKPILVFILAFDNARSVYLDDLRQILFWSVLFSLWLSVLFSYLFSKKALKPVSRIIENVKVINSSSLSKRLNEGKGKDELEQLAMTFNDMISDLEISFKNQEEFVSNASHELRTPISVMIAESDYFLSREHDPLEYRNQIEQLVSDLRSINELLSTLLELAQINPQNQPNFSVIRLDEIIFNAIFLVKSNNKDRKIVPKIHYSENESDLLILGNPGLLAISFKNLIENACKFSDDDVMVEMTIEEHYIKVVISDKGIGIPKEEIGRILKPFSRASNARFKGGYGVGLSLVSKIAELHGISIQIESIENEGSEFILLIKRFNQ
jgi:signal transduction histidine kinase